MWSKEECAKLIKKLFSLELSERELDDFYNYLLKNQITPPQKGGGNTIGFTPKTMLDLLNFSLIKSGMTIKNNRFKRINEEVFPAILLTLLYKKLGLGEFIIISSDNPDIILVPNDQDFNKISPIRIKAFPIENIFLTQKDVDEEKASSDAEKIANIIIRKKIISKTYIPSTTLLITLNAEQKSVNLSELSNILLNNKQNKFHQIWIIINRGDEECVIASLTPIYAINEINVNKDLLPLLY